MIQVPRDDMVVMLEAAYIYLAMCRFSESKKLFEGLAELAPKHDLPMVGIANVHFAQGKYLEAIRTLKQALKDNPGSAYAYAHLGEAQLFYGKRDDATESLEKASSLEPGKEDKSGEFARSLIELMNTGYDPVQLRKHFKEQQSKQESQQAEESR